VSGGLFNIIRGTPMYTFEKDGKPKYFVEGRSYQFGAEGFIMGTLYIVFSLSLVGVMYVAPLIPNKQVRGAVSMGLVATAAMFLQKIFELYKWKASYHPTLFF
jgi:oligosaccharyltransferase complex subunit gamma